MPASSADNAASTRIRIRKGLDIPLAGAPKQEVVRAVVPGSVALLGPDTIGLKPTLAVSEGDRVALGQTLYTDKRHPAVRFTSPGNGVVVAIHRGARRALQSVVIRLDDDAETAPVDPAGDTRAALLESGLWTAFRTRPYSHIPAPDALPAAIFVTAIDTNPHAPDPAVVLDTFGRDAFAAGLRAIGTLTEGAVWVCTAPDSGIQVPQEAPIRHAEFDGPHPAGLVGTHIHFLDPVSERKSVWHIGYQDVAAIGRLFSEGVLDMARVVSLAGPSVKEPRLLATRLGASIADITSGEFAPGRKRILSGSVLGGRRAAGSLAWLGRYHSQVTALPEGSEREFLSWARPGAGKFSAVRAFAGHLLHRRPFQLSTSQNGSPRAMVSTGTFEKVIPLDVLATPLLKALLVEDTDSARELGCLELDEEDLALCSFVCNGKYEYGPFLRRNLELIEAYG